MADGDRAYLTIDGDALDLIAYREYGVSSNATEMLMDYNYRVADKAHPMDAGTIVLLPEYAPPRPLSSIIRLWDNV